jgi:hypothetical protein
MAWTRGVLTLLGLVLTIVTFVFAIDPKAKESVILPGVVAAICWIALGFLCYGKMFTHANFARACQLAKECKLPAAGIPARSASLGFEIRRDQKNRS